MTLYQLPFSPWFRQIVTCRTPMRILCAGCDMMISFSLSFRPHHGALRHAQRTRLSRELSATVKRKAEGFRLRKAALAA